MSSTPFSPTERSTVRRHPERASYDRELVHAILDEGLVCQVGFVVDGRPVVIPTAYGRIGDEVYLHGAPASRMLRALKEGLEVCVSVTLIDGVVLARSAFHHSLNYRSVVIFGRARVLEAAEEKRRALAAFTEHVVHGRMADVREPSEAELAGTLVLAIALEEVSAKVRSGPPVDAPGDLAMPAWAGVIPLAVRAGTPEPDEGARAVPLPAYASGYARAR